MKTTIPEVLTIAGHRIEPGTSAQLELPLGKLYTSTDMKMPVFVRHSRKPGPTLFLSAAIHGDELNGVEIINRLIHNPAIRQLKGTLIAVPIVNPFGVINQSRYLPDRRDLNRSFPGSPKGSLAARMADLFLREIVSHCDYGIDLHTGAIHRSNLPQIRANLDDEATRDMALAFGVPVLLNANLRDGSLREAADNLGVRVLLYEAGEALRYDELCIRAGERGILRVMRHLGMLPAKRQSRSLIESVIAQDSGWLRATGSGFVHIHKRLGDRVSKDEKLASIVDPLGNLLDQVLARDDGIVIGCQNLPLVHEGDAMFNIAYFHRPDAVVENIGLMNDTLLPEETFL
ncbi:succinylglutamate desuccinylase/aspartoacylase family protein [Parathalassolituus penaei]|uniref:Succinylglutamate desuccinylase/aspartoacylase family protein n=1 Tax=Parathalassolituus penaei TaxID=2997323 RepID=A0A9X3IQ47_9GAMM|nr:succinylglutamate desuccinylase/aspartoacylase family protein [Parathalassolituus penaei]MCY0963787.1 succinylglutamate desuccinylase/aspartoacylase family protein [Parathalassolituus penaei]